MERDEAGAEWGVLGDQSSGHSREEPERRRGGVGRIRSAPESSRLHLTSASVSDGVTRE